MEALGKLKHMQYFDKNNPKYEDSTSIKNKENQDENIEELTGI